MGNRTVRLSAAWGIGLAAVLAMTACSSAPAGGGGGDSSSTPSAAASEPSPSQTSEAAEPSVDFGRTPPGAGVPSCASLLPSEQVEALVPGARTTDQIALDHVAGLVFATPTAGGASCLATTGVAPLDDRTPGKGGDALYSGVTVTVLPDAADAEREVADGPVSRLDDECAASDAARVYCAGSVLAGDAWVQVDVTRVQDSTDAVPEQMDEPFRALLDHVQSVVASSGVASASAEQDGDGTQEPCVADNVNAVTDRTLQWDQEGVDVIRTAPTTALTRLGGASCTFVASAAEDQRYGQLQAQYDQVPDGGWVVAQRLSAGTIDRSHRLDLDGLGDDGGAWRTCDDTACSVDVVSDGGDWEHYVLYRDVAPNTSSAIERWVTASRS